VIQPYVDRFLLGEKKEWSEAMLDTLESRPFPPLPCPANWAVF